MLSVTMPKKTCPEVRPHESPTIALHSTPGVRSVCISGVVGPARVSAAFGAAHTTAMSKFVHLVWLGLLITAGCGPASNRTGGGSGASSPALDEITVWLKIEYYPKTPKSPAYLAGQPSI